MPGNARHQGPFRLSGLEDHLGECGEAVRKGGDEGAESVREAAAAITRLVKS